MIEQLDDNIKSESGDSSTSIEQSPLLGPKIDFDNQDQETVSSL